MQLFEKKNLKKKKNLGSFLYSALCNHVNYLEHERAMQQIFAS